MNFKIGEIDLYTNNINQQYQISRILKLLDIIVKKTGIDITDEEFKRVNQSSLEELQKAYPNSGIKFSSEDRSHDQL